MRILVCFRTTPDYEALRESDWAALAAGGGGEGAGGGEAAAGEPGAGAATRYVRRVLNCFDESALELALRLAEARAALGAATELTALSVAGREADQHLKTLRALGFARAARVQPDAALDFAPAATAALIAGYARLHSGDVVLFGCRSGPGDGGTVPFRVAEALGLPGLTQVTEVEPLGGQSLRVTCAADDAPLRVTLRPPCVLAVGNALVSTLRVPTLRDRLAVRDEPVTALSPADVGVDLGAQLAREATGLRGLERIDRRRAGVVVPGATPAEQARSLYESHVRAALEAL